MNNLKLLVLAVGLAVSSGAIAKAELEASYKPSVKTRYDASAAAAEANYAVSFEKCNAQTASVKEACVNQAKSAKNDELADAMEQLRNSKPDAASAKVMRNDVSPPQKPILRAI